MEKLILLMESDDSLRENITELLELEGYQISSADPGMTKSVFHKYHPGIVILNKLTLNQPIDQLIGYLKDKVDRIVVLCSDVDDPELVEADLKISLPFNYNELEEQLSNLTNGQTLLKSELNDFTLRTGEEFGFIPYPSS